MSQSPGVPTLNAYPSYKGGCTLVYGGYIYEHCPTHRLCNQWGYVAQHRMISEDLIGRPLRKGEVVHHRDEVRTNNAPDNLEVMTKSAHHQHHALIHRRKAQNALTAEMVERALQGRQLKQAASLLGVHTQTLRNRFPELLAPRKRKSPTQIDDPQVVETIRLLAPNPTIGYREIAHQHQIATMTVKRICERHDIPWVKKTRKGEKRRPYRRRNAIPPG